jgi:hypothetical protein
LKKAPLNVIGSSALNRDWIRNPDFPQFDADFDLFLAEFGGNYRCYVNN